MIGITQKIPFQRIMILRRLRIVRKEYQNKWRELCHPEVHPVMDPSQILSLHEVDLLKSHLDPIGTLSLSQI